MDYNHLSLELHEENKGKLEVISKVPVQNKDDLSTAYTPGVAAPCLEIEKNPDLAYKYTLKNNMVAVVSDGSAVLGLGNIGAKAAIPVMEGKAVLFKEFANVDAFPICLDTQDIDEIVKTVVNIAPAFGGINLEDISAPRCFEVEKRLKEQLDIPVFHDDQHGTAIVVAAALINSFRLTNRKIETASIVINGAGSAGIAIAKLLLKMGAEDIVLCGKHGAIYKGDPNANQAQLEMTLVTNKRDERGQLREVLKNKDVFIGVSVGNIVNADMIAQMNSNAIVLAMANPIPEIMPNEAKKGGAKIIGTGRSDFNNQVNNVLAFPGIFRGALDVRASDINKQMQIAAAYAIANTLEDDEISENMIIPKAFDKRVGANVAKAVADEAIKSGVAKFK